VIKTLLAAAMLLAAMPAHAADIRVLVTYTAKAEAKMIASHGSVAHYTGLMMENVNRAMVISRTGHVISTAGFYKFGSYNETDLYTDIDRIIAVGDGKLDAVHTQRNNKAGDVVVFIADYDEGQLNTGIAGNQPSRSSADAFVACDVDRCNGSGEWVFAHEIGHLAGCAHESGATVTRGYMIPGTNITDLMHTSAPPFWQRLLFYSTNIVLPNFYGMTNVRIGDAQHNCGGAWIFYGNVLASYR
jgi:hypothetical protein